MTGVKWVALCLSLSTPISCASNDRAPSPALSPADVVRLQVEALAGDEANRGIAVTFRFASPANKEMTGPLERFIEIVRAPAYRPLVNHRAAEYGELRAKDGQAMQIVTVTARDGSVHAFLFLLSRQREGRWDGCWMTDSVHPLQVSQPPGLSI